jgi:hypothetical protein
MILVKGYAGKLGLCDGLEGRWYRCKGMINVILNGSVGFFTRIEEDYDILC